MTDFGERKERPEEENDGGVPRLRSFAAPVRDKMIPVKTLLWLKIPFHRNN